MGHELLPFREEDAAKEFKDDHRGKQILGFTDVTPATIETLARVR
jgi:nitrous oxide reductase accessory protein NosL